MNATIRNWTRNSFRLLVVLLFILNPCFGVFTESVQREDQLTEERRQKMQEIQPEHQGAFERLLLKLQDKFRTETHDVQTTSGFSAGPRIGSITYGSGIAVGAQAGTSYLQSWAAYSYHGFQEYAIQVGLNPPRQGMILEGYYPGDIFRFDRIRKKPGMFAYADVSYHDFPQVGFYGLGPDSLPTNHTDFQFKQAAYNGVVGYQFARWVRVDLRGGLLQPSVGSGTAAGIPVTQTVFNDATAPGLASQPDFWRISSSVLVDYRDNPGNPHAGGALGVTFFRFDDRNSNVYNFNRVTVDTRQFVPLGSSARVLAFRFLTSLSDGGTDNVPFYLQETLGGGHALRGFPDFRFRDRNLMALSSEYRFEAAPWLELAVFYDTGKVFPYRSQFNFSHLEQGYGGGVRFKTPDGVLVRIDAGKSDEGLNIYFSFGPSF